MIGLGEYVFDGLYPSVEYESDDLYVGSEGVLINKVYNIEPKMYCRVFSDVDISKIVFGFSGNASKLYLWCIYHIKPNLRYVFIDIDVYMADSRIESKSTFYEALNELIRYGVLANTKKKKYYWVNIAFFYRGDRLKNKKPI